MTPRQEGSPKIRKNLTRRDVTTAAIDLIERSGLEALTMRRLAAELGYGTMSLYSHVRNRDDLIDAIVDELIRRLDLRVPDNESWQHVIRRTLGAYRDLAVRVPNTFELLALAPYESSRVAAHLSSVISSLEQSGLEHEQARQVLGIVDAYASGFLVVWTRSRSGARTGTQPASLSRIGGLRELEMFDRGLDALIAGLNATVVAPNAPATPDTLGNTAP